MTEDVVLGLGSNLGDRRGNLAAAVRALGEKVAVTAVSSIYESPAVIFEEQPDFLNLVLVGRTALAPTDLLRFIHGIERAAGRVRSFRGAPRSIDIDILLFGDRSIHDEGLVIPHLAWKERAFVLAPMAEVVPGRVDPESGKTVQELWRASAPLPAEVRRVFPPPYPEDPSSVPSEENS